MVGNEYAAHNVAPHVPPWMGLDARRGSSPAVLGRPAHPDPASCLPTTTSAFSFDLVNDAAPAASVHTGGASVFAPSAPMPDFGRQQSDLVMPPYLNTFAAQSNSYMHQSLPLDDNRGHPATSFSAFSFPAKTSDEGDCRRPPAIDCSPRSLGHVPLGPPPPHRPPSSGDESPASSSTHASFVFTPATSKSSYGPPEFADIYPLGFDPTRRASCPATIATECFAPPPPYPQQGVGHEAEQQPMAMYEPTFRYGFSSSPSPTWAPAEVGYQLNPPFQRRHSLAVTSPSELASSGQFFGLHMDSRASMLAGSGSSAPPPMQPDTILTGNEESASYLSQSSALDSAVYGGSRRSSTSLLDPIAEQIEPRSQIQPTSEPNTPGRSPLAPHETVPAMHLPPAASSGGMGRGGALISRPALARRARSQSNMRHYSSLTPPQESSTFDSIFGTDSFSLLRAVHRVDHRFPGAPPSPSNTRAVDPLNFDVL
jgi:hypothetical protein